MKFLVILDMIKQEVVKDAFIKTFSEDEIDFYYWEIPSAMKDFQKIILKIEKGGAEVVPYNESIYTKIDTFKPDIILSHFAPINQKMIEGAKENLKIVGVMRGGIENVNIEKATQYNIPVLNAPGRNANAVAEFTIALMLSEYKNISRGHAGLKMGKWRRRYSTGDFAHEIEGKIVGLIGFGKIGQLVAKKLINGFGCEVNAYDPFTEDDIFNRYNVRKCSLDKLLIESDIVSIHARLSKGTMNLIGERELSLMKPSSYLINTARAGLIDREALYQALLNRKIAGAGIDVFWNEPIDLNNDFINLDNITMSPHYAGTTVEAMSKSPLILFERVKKYFLEKDYSLPVNKINR